MIDISKVDELCSIINNGPHSGGVDHRTESALLELERLIGRPAIEYTRPLRRLLAKKRLDDAEAHSVEVYGQTLRISGIASICNQWEQQRAEREALFKVEVPEPRSWPETGDVRLTASVYVEGQFYKHIKCTVSASEIDSMPITSRSLPKWEARMRRLGQGMRHWCVDFRLHIERLWEQGNDLSEVDEINRRELKAYR